MNTSDVLNKAADEIERRGWTAKGTDGWVGFAAADGPVCMEGGIMAALGVSWHETVLVELWQCPAYQAVETYLHGAAEREGGVPASPLWRFNDATGRTASEVVATLRAVALIEAAKEQDTPCVADLPEYAGADPGWLHGMFECDAHPRESAEVRG